MPRGTVHYPTRRCVTKACGAHPYTIVAPMPRRVVITGMGSLSPNGNGNTAFCRAILDGRSGVGRITRFDVKDLPVRIAGELKDFDELAWIDAHERKHVSRAVPMAMAASSEALADAGFDATAVANMSLEQK